MPRAYVWRRSEASGMCRGRTPSSGLAGDGLYGPEATDGQQAWQILVRQARRVDPDVSVERIRLGLATVGALPLDDDRAFSHRLLRSHPATLPIASRLLAASVAQRDEQPRRARRRGLLSSPSPSPSPGTSPGTGTTDVVRLTCSVD